MRTTVAGVGVAALLICGCVHQKAETKEVAARAPEKKTGGGEKQKVTGKVSRADREAKASDNPEPLTLSKTTRDMFKPDGLKKMQQALSKKMSALEKGGEIEGEPESGGGSGDDRPPAKVKETGKLDADTQAALRAFQKSEKMPETGLPDYETLRRLGVKPSEVFEHLPTSERKGVPPKT